MSGNDETQTSDAVEWLEAHLHNRARYFKPTASVELKTDAHLRTVLDERKQLHDRLHACRSEIKELQAQLAEAEREQRTVWYAHIEDSWSQPYATRQLALHHAEAMFRDEFGDVPIEWRPFDDDERAEPELRMIDDCGYPLPWYIHSGPILTSVASDTTVTSPQ